VSDKITVLLVDDQLIIAESVKHIISREANIDFHWCQDPTEALNMAITIKPHVILQDLIMPEIDGLMLVKYFRAHLATKDIPIIVLSIKEDPEIKASAFMEGANDYMVKLPDKEEFLARIRYHSRAYRAFLERNDAFQKLEESQNALKKEIDEAANYVQSLLPKPFKSNHIEADFRLVPSTVLAGDILGYQMIDQDHFAFYLIDVCGHGVGAALLSSSIINRLREKSVFDFLNPAHVLEGLNRLYQVDEQNNLFFSIWYGVYCISEKTLTYANAGHPPVVIRHGNTISKLTPSGVMVGVMPETSYENTRVQIDLPSRLYLFSDGVFEYVLKDGHASNLPDFISYLKTFPAESIPQDFERVSKFARGERSTFALADDFSIIIVDFS